MITAIIAIAGSATVINLALAAYVRSKRRAAYRDGYQQGRYDEHMDTATGIQARPAFGAPTTVTVYDHETEGL